MYVYDLSRCPASYDFLNWLAICATHAQGEFHVSILRGPKDGFRDDELEPQDWEVRRQMLDNVLIPATRLWNVKSLTLFPKAVSGKKPGYMINEIYIGLPIPSLKVPEWALRIVRARYPKPPVVISLRSPGHHPSRDSNIEEWEKAAERLRFDFGEKVVFVGDAPVRDYETFPEAICLPLRAALYQHAKCVLGVNNGPQGTLGGLNAKVRYLTFKMLAPTPATTMEWFGMLGYAGTDYPWAYPWQHLVWEPDNADTIIEAYQALPEKTEEHDYFPAVKWAQQTTSQSSIRR